MKQRLVSNVEESCVKREPYSLTKSVVRGHQQSTFIDVALAIRTRLWIMFAVSATATTDKYYAHSGHAPAGGLALGITGGAAIGALLAVVYAYFVAVIPFVYLNIIGAVAVGMITGLVTGKMLVRGRVRNNKLAAAAGFVVGVITLYVAWAAWLHAFLDKAPATEAGFGHLLINPPALWALIKAVNQHGAWKLQGSVPTGIALWLAWASEAAIIVGYSIITARSYVASEPFCEKCNRWCVEEPRVLETHGFDAEELKRRLDSKDFAYLASLGPRTPSDVEWFRFDLHRCQGCGSTATLTAKSVDLTRTSEKSKPVLTNLLVSQLEVERLRRFYA